MGKSKAGVGSRSSLVRQSRRYSLAFLSNSEKGKFILTYFNEDKHDCLFRSMEGKLIGFKRGVKASLMVDTKDVSQEYNKNSKCREKAMQCIKITTTLSDLKCYDKLQNRSSVIDLTGTILLSRTIIIFVNKSMLLNKSPVFLLLFIWSQLPSVTCYCI